MSDQSALARRIVAVLDLTSLTGQEDETAILALCQRAVTPAGRVAALCLSAPWLPLARRTLEELGANGVALATVANFPEGHLDSDAARHEIATAVELGATEVDLVFPYRAFVDGQHDAVRHFLSSCREACPLPLKVILETGILGTAELIASASRLAIACGADFLKTSTGKAPVHATLAAARIMLETIAAHGGGVGFKASGGLRTMADVVPYLELASELLGADWVTPAHFRFGASSLLDDLLIVHGSAD